MLYKSNVHITYPKSETKGNFLSQMIDKIINEAYPQLIMSIGTTGGCQINDKLGTVNVVNSATLYQKDNPEQSCWPTYTTNFNPNWSIIDKPEFQQLLFKIPTDWRRHDHYGETRLEALAEQFIYKNRYLDEQLTFDQLNARELDYPNDTPHINNFTQSPNHLPLLTASSFVVGLTNGNFKNFAVIDMDEPLSLKLV